ncbi:MAG: cysteine desulfurase, partial [Chlamydiae bacterium]|nr:cysteine desulfurase [Chlamydiota bacterium]
NATTPLDPRVLQAMLQDLNGVPANPSSNHWFGQLAKSRLIDARQSISSYFQAKPSEITFTSSGTEAINLMLRSLKPNGHLITTSIEHPAMYRTIQTLEIQGLSVTYVPVGLLGAPLSSQIEEAIRPETKAIALSLANNETGVKTDIQNIADLAGRYGIPLLLDCVSFIGKEPFPHHPAIQAIALSGHKFHAPKGIGLLWHRSSLKIFPLITGGNQEQLLRAGTENLSGILGLSEALKILSVDQPAITNHLMKLKERFENGLKNAISDVVINGDGPRMPNTSNLAFLGVDGETLLIMLDQAGIAASHGSACSSGALEPSRVLLQMGIDKKRAKNSIRFSLSRLNTTEEIDQALEVIVPLVRKLKP